MQSDDNSLADHQSSINDYQSYISKCDYDARQTDPTPPPHQNRHSQRNLRKRRRSVHTTDDIGPRQLSPTQRITQTSLPSASPPKFQISEKPQNSALNRPCEAELVDGFCKYLAMQLKRLSAKLFIDVQMDVQKIVLQAQRFGLEMAVDNEYDDERSENIGNSQSNGRMTNGLDEQHSVMTNGMDESMGSRKGGDDELEWEECQIKVNYKKKIVFFLIVFFFKNEPIDDELDEMYAAEALIAANAESQQATSLSVNHLVKTKTVKQVLSTPRENVVLPRITTIEINTPEEPSSRVLRNNRNIQNSSINSVKMKVHRDHLIDATQHLVLQNVSQIESTNKPENAFPTPAVIEPSSSLSPRIEPSLKVDDPKDNIIYTDLASAVTTLSGAISTLSTATV